MHSLEDLNTGNVWGWPLHPALADNFRAVLGGSRIGAMAVNSFLVTLPAVFFTVLLSAMAGFALAKHRFAGNRLMLMAFVAGNLVPLQVLMIPVRDIMIALHLYATRVALIVFHTPFQTGLCTLFMRKFNPDLPDTHHETARVDGAGEIALFFRVVLPVIRPAIAAVSVLIFTFVWNDYFWSLVLVQSDAIRPLTAGLQALRGMWQTSWNLVAAASLLAAVPPVVLFFLMQQHLISGLTGGSPRD
jgi:multiple sugar transport system permease protein